jgi:beta-lactam-binding protein with PASTA domain
MISKLRKNSSTLGGILMSLLITLGVLFVVMVLYFYVYLPSMTNHGETITVPSVEGMSIEELDDFLVSRNLRYEVSDSAFSDKYPPLTILKQYPASGSKVKEGRVIYLSVNRTTPPTVPMPNLVDGSLVNAEAVLRGNELKRGHIELVHGPFLHLVKKMKYKGNEIEPGTRVPKGAVIDLVIEDGGTESVSVPDVLGYSLEDAKVPIFGSNLSLGPVHVAGDTIGAEAVVILMQKPHPGTLARIGDLVEIWIGPKGLTLSEDGEIINDENDNQ